MLTQFSDQDIKKIQNKLSESFDRTFLWPIILITPIICGAYPFIKNQLLSDQILKGMNLIDSALLFTMMWVGTVIVIILLNNLRIKLKVKKNKSQFVKYKAEAKVVKMDKQFFKSFQNVIHTNLKAPYDIIRMEDPIEISPKAGDTVWITIEETTGTVLNIDAKTDH